MGYGEKYIRLQSDGSLLLQEDHLPSSLKEAKIWEDFGKRIGAKLTQIALLQYQNKTEETAYIPKLSLVHSNQKQEATEHVRYPSPPTDHMSEARLIADGWSSVYADIHKMREILATPANPSED